MLHMTPTEERETITRIASRFPSRFGLKEHEGVFRLEPDVSYIDTQTHIIQMYIYKLDEGDVNKESWRPFAKATVTHIREWMETP